MRINGGSASSGWHHTSADPGPDDHGRRPSSSKLASGAAFGALLFTPGPVFEEDTPESGEVDDVFGVMQWKAE
jgi:hypothetical protein